MEVKVEQFIERWQGQDGTERANYQLFLTELCDLLELPKPEPASSDTEQNAYVFERRVDINHPDGSQTRGYIDLYKRGSFVLEAKQTSQKISSERWDKSMLRAQAQADTYIRALPSEEGRPPFLIVTDVGRTIELYSEFSRSGSTYVPFPDPRSHRIKVEDLRDESIRQRLIQVWNKPLDLDPSKQSALVTREVAANLAELAKSLESQYGPEIVASFLMRCLFTMFAEDVELIPLRSFTGLLESLQDTPDHLIPMLEGLWETMNTGGFSPQLRQQLLKFNGGLFAEGKALPLNKEQIKLLIQAARSDWRYVEPAIFGTLLERALNPSERHKLGAHYTPRAYVERLVLPTVIEPLREEWRDVQAVAAALEHQGKHAKAINEVRGFHIKLCGLRILDPACGSGNFLYVTLEHIKRLEGEILNFLESMGETQTLLEMDGITVDPHQFHGIEINPRAAKIAEMVLWIGYLQWHFRSQGNVQPPEPVLRDFHNIECRDALLDYDSIELLTDEHGRVVTQWDGKTTKTHLVTGKQVPDETACIQVEKYTNPRKAHWPKADYVVGNPPFIGAASMRSALGAGYVDALRNTWKEIPESSDFVMYWWHNSAELARNSQLHRFGFITTNSIKQTFNRRVVQSNLEAKKPLSIVYAIPDHPWVDSGDGADVRIAMSAGQGGSLEGTVVKVIKEKTSSSEEKEVTLYTTKGLINADLTAGANLSVVQKMVSNSDLSGRGVQLSGAGFIVTHDEASKLGLGHIPGIENHIRKYRNGRDINQKSRNVLVIDLFGLTENSVRLKYPEIFQHILERIKPERDQNKRESVRKNWWVFGEPRKEWRRMYANVCRYISTVETSKHRIFVFLEKEILPDNKLINIAIEDAYYLGVLSSRLHAAWSIRAGSRLGVGNDPVYVKSTCYETFPFPETNANQKNNIRQLAEQLDAHRKQRQEKFTNLTLTSMYNVMEKLRVGEVLTDKDKVIHKQGLVSVLKEIHDDLDRAVFNAYGWDELGDKLIGLPGATTPLPDKEKLQGEAEEEMLKRLVDLNVQRAIEESQGYIRWLRPEFQTPVQVSTQIQIKTDANEEKLNMNTTSSNKLSWPKELQLQIKAVRGLLSTGPMSTESISNQFKRKPVKGVSQVLDALSELGMINKDSYGVYST